MVFKNGKLVAEDGHLLPGAMSEHSVYLRSSMNVRLPDIKDFEVSAER